MRRSNAGPKSRPLHLLRGACQPCEAVSSRQEEQGVRDGVPDLKTSSVNLCREFPESRCPTADCAKNVRYCVDELGFGLSNTALQPSLRLALCFRMQIVTRSTFGISQLQRRNASLEQRRCCSAVEA